MIEGRRNYDYSLQVTCFQSSEALMAQNAHA